MKRFIYLDNAATSFPKPPVVREAMVHYLDHVGANPGRAGHRLSLEAGRIVGRTRSSLARLFNAPEPERIVFTLNVTEALNTVFEGLLTPGDHVIITAMEHNAVTRPLRHMQAEGRIVLDVAPCDHRGELDIDTLAALRRPETALVVLNHASNVCGTIQDAAAVKAAAGEIPLLVDAAQTAGSVPIDVQADGIDLLAFTGHKGLMGPQGTGGLYIRPGLGVRPLKRGGTGSESERSVQPDFLPDALESGTQNNVGIAGLGAAVDFILSTGVETIRRHERELVAALIASLFDLPAVVLYGPLDPARQTATLSLTFDAVMPAEMNAMGCGALNLEWLEDGVSQNEAGKLLDGDHDIFARVGLHCAPLAHRTLGTFPDGTVRLSMGWFNTREEVDIAAAAIRRIAAL